jgi:multidrug efflux pump subunit AcrB
LAYLPSSIRVAVRQPVLLNLVFWLVVIAGLLAYWRMPKEEFPPISTDRVVVVAAWPGSSPEDIEDGVLRPVEEAVAGVPGLRHTFSEATQGRALLTLEFVRGTDTEAAAVDVRRAVDGLEGLPVDVIGPEVEVAAVQVVLTHAALVGDPRRIDVAQTIADELRGLPGVSDVELEGAYERRVKVELNIARATAMGVTVDDVSNALKAASIGAPAGSLEGGGDSVLVRTRKGIEEVDDLANVPLSVAGGTHVTVGDVARIRDDWVEPDVTFRVNGQPAIHFVILRQDSADALRSVPPVTRYLLERSETLPEGLALVPHDSSSYLLSHRLAALAGNGLLGLVLVALLLGAFVGIRNGLLVVWGMPVAFLGAMAAMHIAGVSLNLISMFALLLVTGIIVDDAVIIVENAQRHLEMGKSRLQAALDGTAEVFSPVMAATLTTCLAFAPLLMLEGLVGRVMRIIPTVIMLALVASLIEAFFILPGHFAHHGRHDALPDDNGPTRFVRRLYEPILRRITDKRWRWPSMIGIATFVLLSISLAGVMRLSLTTPGRPVFAYIELTMAPSAGTSTTRAALQDVEKQALAEAEPLLRFIRSKAGVQGMPDEIPLYGPRYGQILLGFHDDPDEADAVRAFLDRTKRRLERRPDVTEVSLTSLGGGPPVGKPVDVRVRGEDAAAVSAAVDAAVAHLEARPGVSGIRADSGRGADSFEVRVDPARAARVGLREGEVARAMRSALDGAVALEMQIDGWTAEVRVGLPEVTAGADVQDLPVRVANQGSVRLRQVADVARIAGVGRVARVDGARSVRVVSELDDEVSTASAEQTALEGALEDHQDGVTLLWGGEAADTAESFERLPYAAILALLLIYAVLAVQFGSYLQPIIILAAVPLGVAGVILGLFVFRLDLSLSAMIGCVGLIGIVVNDSLVLVDFINHRRAEGASARDAVVDASIVRLRPILITTLTTVSGLLPLALGIAGKEPLLAPMAVSLSVGLSFATALTLVAVPVLYLVLDDLGGGDPEEV